MGFESPNLTPREKHEVKPVLKDIVRMMLGHFEERMSGLERIDYRGPSAERYRGMGEAGLIGLHQAVDELRERALRMRMQFPELPEAEQAALDGVISKANDIMHSKMEGEKFLAAGETEVDEELANTLGNEMHALRESMETLKNSFK
ncbi:MAG TPA: hypothetical protein VHC46_07395 [Thermodesulfobacteriota bacterium]|nr:hypothetical protein [Thermodesulfobacteriota bacterium]